MNPLDELNSYADAAAGDEDPVATAPRRASGDNGATLKEQALAGLPPEWRERLIRDAGDAGVRHDEDVGWLLVGSVVHSAMAAFAAGAAAQAVQSSVDSIPARILSGAARAGEDVRGALEQNAIALGQTLSQAGRIRSAEILAAADTGAEKIRASASTLTAALDRAIAAKKQDGVDQFAQAAAAAAAAAARAAAQGALGHLVARSAGVMLVVLAAGAVIGAAGIWEYLETSHKIMPVGVRAYQFPGGAGGVVALPGASRQDQEICGPGAICIRTPGGVPRLP